MSSKPLHVRHLISLILLSGFVSTTQADTTIKDQATEGKISYHALVIGHGCEEPSVAQSLPVKAQSVVFPTLNPQLTRNDTGESMTLDSIIEDDTGRGLAGRVEVIQDRNIFKFQALQQDKAGNTVGFNSTGGTLQSGFLGLVPFRFSAVNFVKTSCIKRLYVKVAVADVCSMTFPPKPGTAELWLPSATTRFRNPMIIGEPATLIVNRDLNTNPLPTDGSCGDGFDATLLPSREDIDTHLPFKGWGRK